MGRTKQQTILPNLVKPTVSIVRLKIKKNFALKQSLSISIYIYIRMKNNVMAKEPDTQLTSVKVDKDLFDVFKIECVKRKFTLNKLVNRTIDLYLTDPEFRKQLTNHINPNIKE